MNELSQFLSKLRQVNPRIMTDFFLYGSCLQLYRIVKIAFKDAECWYQPSYDQHGKEDDVMHIWIKWRGKYYDILGQLTSKRKDSIYNGYGRNLKPFNFNPKKRYTWGNCCRGERLQGVTYLDEE